MSAPQQSPDGAAFIQQMFLERYAQKVQDDALNPDPIAQNPAPILWLNGKRASVAPQPRP